MPNEPAAETDEQLVRRVLEGDSELYGAIVERYQSRLVNYLHRLVRNVDDAHDLAQEVFIRVYNALDRYDPRYRFTTWLFRVAQNAAIDQLRRRRFRMVPIGEHEDEHGEMRRGVVLEDDAPSALERIEGNERDADVRVAIDALPWEYRELIVMRHYGEMAYDEIAQAKEMPLGTVKNKLFRARQMLKAKLVERMEEVEE